jgi:hypothetical protein
MLTAAAVCPHPPVLVREATGGPTGPGALELAKLRNACDTAVAAVAQARPDVIVVVGADTRTIRYPPQAAGTLAAYGVPFTVGTGTPVLPLSLTVGRWLTDTKAGPERTVLQAIAADATPATCMLLGAQLAELAPDVAILAMGDGPGRRARRAPGAIDADADRYDKLMTNALAIADATQLADLDTGHDEELFIAGRAAWQVLAGAALADADANPHPGDARFASTLRYAAAPFEVSYYVATWLLIR